ncbi:FAD:protein FMN transferase [Fodinisporobacter ferrooxydans]|uniref:FAD:protein FMN transferase n=1 Tax=Fodinisporobacter ferrooxydans TaxID=2901836 RepID=A0ABY4CQ03_9BACL|nr:FAD:protein FMN transferase [Alicyclobacillaceae bacterium MYW30-H2]
MMTHTAKRTFVQSTLCMGTVVSVKVVTAHAEMEAKECMTRAFDAFHFVERVCSRFHEQSELRRLSMHVATPVRASDILFEAIRFAWAVANLTGGVFDPTIGHTLETYGFNRHYLTGDRIESNPWTTWMDNAENSVSYLDVELNEENRTVLLRKPLLLDLGAVAKGLAVDIAAKELNDFEGFVIDAGGDLYVGGMNEQEEPWLIGIQHPYRKEESICSVRVTDMAVCTSGSYERKSPVKERTHHLIDPRSGTSQPDIVSCTVIAPFAMMADAFSTAAFILGHEQGVRQLEQVDLDGLLITPNLDIYTTNQMKRYLYEHK